MRDEEVSDSEQHGRLAQHHRVPLPYVAAGEAVHFRSQIADLLAELVAQYEQVVLRGQGVPGSCNLDLHRLDDGPRLRGRHVGLLQNLERGGLHGHEDTPD